MRRVGTAIVGVLCRDCGLHCGNVLRRVGAKVACKQLVSPATAQRPDQNQARPYRDAEIRKNCLTSLEHSHNDHSHNVECRAPNMRFRVFPVHEDLCQQTLARRMGVIDFNRYEASLQVRQASARQPCPANQQEFPPTTSTAP